MKRSVSTRNNSISVATIQVQSERNEGRVSVESPDMVMPEVDGHDLIMTIRRMCPVVKTMAMSGALLPNDSRHRNYFVLPKSFTQDSTSRRREADSPPAGSTGGT